MGGEGGGKEDFEGKVGIGLPGGEMGLDEARGGFTRLKKWVCEDGLEKFEIGGETEQNRVVQGGLHFADGGGAIFGVDDDFGEEGIVMGGERVSCLEAGIHADTRPGRGKEGEQGAAGGQKTARRVFCIEADFQGVAARGKGVGEERGRGVRPQ